jgi:hypothetical protein
MQSISFEYAYDMRPRNWPQQVPHLAAKFTPHHARFAEELMACGEYAALYADVEVEANARHPHRPHWNNGYLPALDGVGIGAYIGRNRASRYVEVGSGNSTRFARHAIDKLKLATRITSIDPYPRADIDEICHDLQRVPFEQSDMRVFESLSAGDIVLIDNSHRSFANSDVTVFFCEVLPRLKPGVVYGIHDIFLPYDYPAAWNERAYNEQYLLAAYLLGGAGGDEILLPASYCCWTDELKPPVAKALQGLKVDHWGGMFWARKA